MKKQRKTQLVLISIGLLLVLLTYLYYPYINKNKLSEDQFVQEDSKEIIDDDNFTTFENVEYEGLYNLSEPFLIKSRKAYILDKEPDIVYMTDMHVIIHLKDERIVNIISNKGKYNKITHDCFFEENVKAMDGETIIFADNLDLLATENFVKVYNKVRLDNPIGLIRADQIDYDFKTKYFKVSMFDDKAVNMKVIQ